MGLRKKKFVRKRRKEIKSEGQKEKERGGRSGGELVRSQGMLICRYIKKWEDLFRNIDFHTEGMKKRYWASFAVCFNPIMDCNNRDCL